MTKQSEKIDPRVRRTRQTLQQAMSALMREKDFQAISVQDIAERADLNRATFYKHFLDKYDLLNAIIRDRLKSMLDERLAGHTILNAISLNILLQTVYDYMTDFHGDCKLHRGGNEGNMMLQQVQQQIYEVLLCWLQNSATQADGAQSRSPEIIALLISWMIFGPFMQVAWKVHKLPPQELMAQVAASAEFALKEYLVEDAGV